MTKYYYCCRWNETDPNGLCGFIALYQVYLDHKGEDIFKANPSFYRNASDEELNIFRENFSTFLQNGSEAFINNLGSEERSLGVKFTQAIKHIRDPNIACPFTYPNRSFWMNAG